MQSAQVENTIFEHDPEVNVENTSIWIVKHPSATTRFFFCNTCRSGLFKYKGAIVSIIPGDPDAELTEDVNAFPFYVRCYGRSQKYGRCPMGYIIQGYVEPLN